MCPSGPPHANSNGTVHSPDKKRRDWDRASERMPEDTHQHEETSEKFRAYRQTCKLQARRFSTSCLRETFLRRLSQSLAHERKSRCSGPSTAFHGGTTTAFVLDGNYI